LINQDLSQYQESDARQVDLIRQDLLTKMRQPNIFTLGAAAVAGILLGRSANRLWWRVSTRIGRELFKSFPEV